MKKGFRWALALVLAVSLTACAAIPGRELQVGDKVGAYWFDFTVDSVETALRYGDRQAAQGCRLVVCHVTLKNTFDEPVPMSWMDFVLLWTPREGDHTSASASLDGMDSAYPIERRCDEQLPDEYQLEKGETRQGTLVYEAPQEVARAALMFQELFDEGESGSAYSEGARYMVWMDF